MRLKRKFAIQFYIFLSLIIGITTVGIYTTMQVQQSYEFLENELNPTLDALKSMNTCLSKIISSTMEYSILHDSGNVKSDEVLEFEIEKEKALASNENAKTNFEKEFTKYTELMSKNFDSSKSNIENIQHGWDAFNDSQVAMLNSMSDIKDDKFFALMDEFTEDKEQLATEIEAGTSFIQNQIRMQHALVYETLFNIIFTIIIIGSIFGIVTVLIRNDILRSMILPISNLGEITNKISKGDLKIKIPELKTNDEMSELYGKVNEMMKNMNENHQQTILSERLSAIGELAAKMAHDIRNPLTVLINCINMMEKETTSSTEKKQLSFMSNSVNRISHQVNDVLEYVKSGQLYITKTSLLTLLYSVVNSMEIKENIHINLPTTDQIIFCDYEKFRIVFINLITNAIQAMGKQGQITIRSMEIPEEDKIVIEVEDTGPGIPVEDQEKIFRPLFTTKQTGTGLGLASVKSIIENHNGMIAFHNNPTTFKITLPSKSYLNQDENPLDQEKTVLN